jgi:hypothetical protein
MSDVKKTIEIALNIVGADTKSTKKVITAFDNVTKQVDLTTASVTKFQESLKKITAPKSLVTIAESLKGFKDFKPPNITKFVANLSELGKIEKFPPLLGFVNQLIRISGIKIPSLVPFANGAEKLVKVDLSKLKSQITVMESGLKKLAVINLDKLESVLRNLAKTNLGAVNSQLNKTKNAIKDTGDVAQSS